MSDKSNICYIQAAGQDVVGLVGLLSSMIAEVNGNIINIEENVIHGLFSIFVIVDLTEATISYENLKERMNYVGHQTNLNIFTKRCYECDTVIKNDNMLVILIGQDQPGIVSKISILLSNYGINIEHIRMIARNKLFAMELIVDKSKCTLPLKLVKSNVSEVMGKLNISVIFQLNNLFTKEKRLVVFDIDTSEIKQELKVTIKKSNYNIEKIQKYIDSNTMDLLKGLPVKKVQEIIEQISYDSESKEFIEVLKHMGYKIALISEKNNLLVEKIGHDLAIDFCYSNILDINDNGTLTGHNKKPDITDERKHELISEIAKQNELNDDEIILFGSGIDFNTDPYPKDYKGNYLYSGINCVFKQPVETSFSDYTETQLAGIISLF